MDFNTLQFLLTKKLITLSFMAKGKWLWSSLGPSHRVLSPALIVYVGYLFPVTSPDY